MDFWLFNTTYWALSYVGSQIRVWSVVVLQIVLLGDIFTFPKKNINQWL